MVQNQQGRAGDSLSSSSSRQSVLSWGGTRSQPEGHQRWGYRISQPIAGLGTGCMGAAGSPPQPHPLWGFPLTETSCAATEFRCRDGTCIGNSSRCNQFIDCEDASDEMNCSECPSSAPCSQLCPDGAAPVLCACGCSSGSLHRVSVLGMKEKGPASCPVTMSLHPSVPCYSLTTP